MNGLPGYRWVIAIATLGLLVGCTKQAPESTATGSGDAAAAASAKPVEPASDLTLIELKAIDGTPPDSRPEGFTVKVDALLQRAAYAKGGFTKGKADAKDGCGLTANLIYVLTANRKAVQKTDVGEARAGLLGELHCERGDKVISFRADVEHLESFDVTKGSTGKAALERVVDRVADTLIQQLAGQVMMRGADDALVLKTLASDDHVGKLMEAALEAGERKLATAQKDLIKHTAHPHPTVSMRSAAALGMLKARDDDVVRALVAMTRGPDLEKHLVAVNTLGDIGTKLALRYLGSIADGHPEEAIRMIAREALERSEKTEGDATEVAP